MFTIMGADGKEYGPVTAGKLHEWIAGGRANLQTKARRSGETEWKTLADFPEMAQFGTGGTSSPPPVAAANNLAGADTPAAAAAPLTAAPAAPAPLSGDARSMAEDLNGRNALLDVFDCLTRSFELWKANFLPLVGVTLLVVIVQAAAGMIPIVGFVSGLFLNGVFYGGLYYYYLGLVRGEPREVSDAFAGFSKALVPLMLATLLSTGLIILVMLPFLAPILLTLIPLLLQQSQMMPVISPLMAVSILAGGLVVLFLSVSWAFTFMLVIDRGLSPWTAMEVSRRVVAKQWFRVFFVLLLGAILTMLGLIGFFIGVLFTLPLMFGAMIYAYEDLFNPPGPQ
jgi:GYF domain 2